MTRSLFDGTLTFYTPPSLCAIDGNGDFDGTFESIMAKLDAPGAEDGDGEPAAEEQDSAAEEGGENDGAPDEDQPSAEDEGAEPEPALPPIEPPLSWSKEHKEHWASLPRETQEVIHSREQQRDAEVRRSQSELDQLRKSIEPEKTALAQQRQRYADQLNTYIALTETLDPILAEGAKADWAALAQQDPAGTQQKWFQFQHRRQQLAEAVMQRDQIVAQQMQEHLEREGRALVEKVPEWANNLDAARTGIDTLRKGAVDKYGFQPQEVAVIRDHRLALVLKDALAYHELQASVAKQQTERVTAEKTAQQKRAAAPAPRLAPSAGKGTGDAQSRPDRAALRQRGRDLRLRDDERLDAILAQIE